MKVLLVDCYIDVKGGSGNFLPYLPKDTVVWKPVHERNSPSVEHFEAIVITGSAACLGDNQPWLKELLLFLERAITNRIPCFGVCFGHQILAHLCGAKVSKMARPEVGWKSILLLRDSKLWRDVPTPFGCFLSHEDGVIEASENMVVLASSEECPVQAFTHREAPVYGIQFHPEMPREESVKLLAYRAEKHRELNINVDHEKTLILPTGELARTLFHNFISMHA
jgi:GMP synthase (glutamine-hydrolysing)